MALRPIRVEDRHRPLRLFLLALVIATIAAAIGLPIALYLRFVSASSSLYALAAEGILLAFVAFAVALHRNMKWQEEEKLHAQQMSGLIAGPFFLFGGMLLVGIAATELGPDRVIDAGRSLLQFDAFLTVGWTISFTILDRWSKELRNVRRDLMALERKGVKGSGELVLEMEGQPGQAFGELLAAIALFIFSGISRSSLC